MATKLILVSIILMLALIPAASNAVVATGGVGVKVTLTDYDPSPAKPGNYVTLYVKGENPGGGVVENATFELEVDYPFSFKPGEEATRHVGSIGSQESILLEYHLYVDKNALEGTYTLYLKLCLDQTCETFSKTSFQVSVKTGGMPKIEVGLDDSDIFTGGKKGSVTLNVINRGLLDTKFLALELMPNEQFDIISPAKVYVGEVASDDVETAEYEIYVKENVAVNESARIMLPVSVEYSDANDKEYSETQNVYLNVYSKEDLAKMGLVSNNAALVQQGVLIIAGLVFLFIIYKWYKKKFAS